MRKKLFIIFLLVSMLLVCASTVAYGYSKSDVTAALTPTSGAVSSDITGFIKDPLQVVLYVMRIVGMGIAMIMILSFGIKYMVSMPADRAQMMKQSMVYLLGAVLLFGASFIVGLVAKVISEASK